MPVSFIQETHSSIKNVNKEKLTIQRKSVFVAQGNDPDVLGSGTFCLQKMRNYTENYNAYLNHTLLEGNPIPKSESQKLLRTHNTNTLL